MPEMPVAPSIQRVLSIIVYKGETYEICRL